MKDLLAAAVTVFFFWISWRYARACDRI